MLGHNLVFQWVNTMIPTSHTQWEQYTEEGAEFAGLGLAGGHNEL